LKDFDLLTSPAYIVMSAADEFHNNHILHGGGYSVLLSGFIKPTEDEIIDM